MFMQLKGQLRVYRSAVLALANKPKQASYSIEDDIIKKPGFAGQPSHSLETASIPPNSPEIILRVPEHRHSRQGAPQQVFQQPFQATFTKAKTTDRWNRGSGEEETWCTQRTDKPGTEYVWLNSTLHALAAANILPVIGKWHIHVKFGKELTSNYVSSHRESFCAVRLCLCLSVCLSVCLSLSTIM